MLGLGNSLARADGSGGLSGDELAAALEQLGELDTMMQQMKFIGGDAAG